MFIHIYATITLRNTCHIRPNKGLFHYSLRCPNPMVCVHSEIFRIYSETVITMLSLGPRSPIFYDSLITDGMQHNLLQLLLLLIIRNGLPK